MSTVPKPATQKEMVEQLWFVVIGSNGDGLASVTKETRFEIEQLKLQMVEVHSDIRDVRTHQNELLTESDLHAHNREIAEKRAMTVRDWLLILATGVPVLATLIYEVLKSGHGG